MLVVPLSSEGTVPSKGEYHVARDVVSLVMSTGGGGSTSVASSDSRSVGSANDELVLEEEHIDLSVSDHVTIICATGRWMHINVLIKRKLLLPSCDYGQNV